MHVTWVQPLRLGCLGPLNAIGMQRAKVAIMTPPLFAEANIANGKYLLSFLKIRQLCLQSLGGTDAIIGAIELHVSG
jgi:hypothetical protein